MIAVIIISLLALNSPEQIKSESKIQWIPPTGEIEYKSSFDSYLFIPSSDLYDSLTIIFQTHHKVKIDLTVGSIEGDDDGLSAKWIGRINQDTLIRVRSVPNTKAVFKMVAIVRKKGNNQIVAIVPGSDLKTIEKYKWLEHLPQVLTAIFAFVAGVFTILIQKWLDIRLKSRELKKQAELSFIKYLNTELFDHEKSLRKFIKDSSTSPETLATIGHNKLLGDESHIHYLDTSTRKRFFNNIEKYYVAAKRYNLQVAKFKKLDKKNRTKQSSALVRWAKNIVSINEQLKNIQ